MSTLAAAAPTTTGPSRRQKAATTVDRALRGGILGAAVAGLAWLLAGALSATAFIVLVVATVAAAAYTLMREKAPLALWGAIGVGWIIVMIERWAVQSHGGLWVAAAAWLGIVIGARRAGISKWSLPLLAYPVLLGVIVVLSGQDLATPWGTSWLWVAAVLGPVLGARTLLNPRPGKPPADKPV
jgi:hypothetical protein